LRRRQSDRGEVMETQFLALKRNEEISKFARKSNLKARKKIKNHAQKSVVKKSLESKSTKNDKVTAQLKRALTKVTSTIYDTVISAM